MLGTRFGPNFDVTESGIYFIDLREDPPVLTFYEFLTREAKTIVSLHKEPGFFAQGCVRVSPDGRWLFYEGEFPQSEIMLVDNFR